MPNISGSKNTVHSLSRASYIFVGPGSPLSRKWPLLDFQGLDTKNPIVGVPWSVLSNLNLGSPVAASATFIVNAQAAAGAGVLTQANAALDVERTLQYVTSNAGNTTQTLLVAGNDQFGVPQTELITLNGTTIVRGKKAFMKVNSVTISAVIVGTVSVGSDTKLGLPVAVDAGGFDTSVKVIAGAQTADAGTLIFADRTTATSATGDTCGTYDPAAAPNGATAYYLRIYPAMGHNNASDSSFGVVAA